MKKTNLLAVSPIDGRYAKKTEELIPFFSEYALFKYRVEVEIEYLIFLSKIGVVRRLTKREMAKLRKIYLSFSLKDASRIKKMEEKTKHDIKAVEYFLQEKLSLSFKGLITWIHFAATSDDINNISYRLMLKHSLTKVIIPEIKKVSADLKMLSHRYLSTPMLARTHGQAAVPTTFGKEFAVFHNRIERQIDKLVSLEFYAKFGGAVGNWNAQKIAFPDKNWPNLLAHFVKSFDLAINPLTTQSAPSEDMIESFQVLSRINSICLDLSQDMWRYISDNWVVQKGKESDVGSSTMPQKINPIEFENAEGNLTLANSLFESLCRKLPISRLQRDLSDSTVLRNIGVAMAHSLLGYKSLTNALNTIEVNREKTTRDLNENWNILAEALQIILRKHNIPNAYEKIAKETKSQNWSQTDWISYVVSLEIPIEEKKNLLKLTPETYIGFSDSIVEMNEE